MEVHKDDERTGASVIQEADRPGTFHRGEEMAQVESVHVYEYLAEGNKDSRARLLTGAL